MVQSRWRRATDEGADAAASPAEVARSVLLHRLEAAPRTRFELAETLRERNVPTRVASEVLDRFEEVGLINDRSFALQWVESRQRTRQLSSRALGNELRRKGVPAEHIAEALDSVDAQDELAAARQVVLKKARAVAGLPRQAQYRRIAGALARKGYGGEVCAQVLSEVLDDPDHNEYGAATDGSA